MSVIVRGKNVNKPFTVRYWIDGKQKKSLSQLVKKHKISR